MKPQEQTAIENASAIIERFGGIRPMASKIAVPVTTVQGWKKRNVIPVNRLEQIVQAAKDHNVDISDVLKVSAIANENTPDSEIVLTPEVQEPPFIQELRSFSASSESSEPYAATMPKVDLSELTQEMLRAERSAVFKSVMISAVLVVIATGAAVLVLWPQSDVGQGSQRVAQLERSITDLQSTINAQQTQMQVIPQMQAELRQATQNTVTQAVSQAKIIAHDALSPDAGSFNQRAIRLEGHVNAIANAPILGDLLNHFQMQQSSTSGSQELSAAWVAFKSGIAGISPEGLDAALANAAQQNTDAQKIMAGIPPEHLKGAVSALGVSQFDVALGQDNAALDKDLQTLKALSGSSNAILNDAIDKFMPQAAKGVLTPTTLAEHFASISSSIVTASLSDGNVSMAERAKAKLNDVLQIEKGGALVSGTPTQAIVVKTQQLLGQNDIAGAIAALNGLNGAAAEAAAPWIEQAKATLAAQQIKDMLTQNLGSLTAAPVNATPPSPENAAPSPTPPAGNAPASIAPGGGSTQDH